MTRPITLGGSRWLHETTARWRAEEKDAKLDLDKQRMAANTQRPPPRDNKSPLDKLHTNGNLDQDRHLSEILHTAAFRYYSDWYLSGLNPISAMNYDRVSGGGTESSGMPASEMQAHRRQAHRVAREALGERYAAVVDPLVLEERAVSDIRSVVGHKDKNAASAVVVERVNTGLRRLAVHYGMMRPPK